MLKETFPSVLKNILIFHKMKYNPDIGIFGMNVSVTFEKLQVTGLLKRRIQQKESSSKT